MEVSLLSYPNVDPVKICATAAHMCTNSDENHKLPKDFTLVEADKLVRRVLKMGHESIAEHVNLTFKISGISRACSHQLVRYRHASFAQQSQRYVEGVPRVVMPESISEVQPAWDEFHAALDHIDDVYNNLVNKYGIPPEDARYLLPNAANTSLIFTVNARELRHIARQRLCKRAQWEIRDLVRAMVDQVNEVAPVLLEDIGPACFNGDCPEGKLSCGKPWK